MSGNQWHIRDDDGTVYGPMSFGDLAKLVADRDDIPDSVFVWNGAEPSVVTLRLVGEVRGADRLAMFPDGLFEFNRAAVLLLRAAADILRGERLFLAATPEDDDPPSLKALARKARDERRAIATRAWRDALSLDTRLAELFPADITVDADS